MDAQQLDPSARGPHSQHRPSRWRVLALTLSLLLGSALPAGAANANPVEILGLFSDRAVIKTPGGQRLLRVGETSPDGVKLISANAREAVISYQGELHTLTLSNRVTTGFREAESQRVTVSSDQWGQYRIRGAIDNHYVNFLIDTGASVVALSSDAADRMGLRYLNAEKGMVQTAQGTADSYFMILDEVTVAGITVYNVQAAVIEGSYPVDILLGMSFLRQVSIQEAGGVMTLTKKF